ncbi:MAG: hypothetical protein HC888_18720 [Candidatus Competibacteraceae bacterium]|nr:hypothetical protein [Candidatus Competibacteraceae bacterium]
MDPCYAVFDLEQFEKLPPVEPGTDDIEILHRVLEAIEAAPLDVSSSQIHAAFATQLRSNKSERDVLVGIFGLAGILETRDHSGFRLTYVPLERRTLPGRRFVDMAYPACWWRRKDGVNWDAVRSWFGHLT